jgi:acyl carrier protein
MLTKTEVLAQLKTLIAEDLDANIKASEIKNDMALFEGGVGLDSVNLIELIALVEGKFGIHFSDEELNPECFSTMTILTDTILDKLQQLGAAAHV